MRYLSLFSGIGGDMLAAERAGFELAGSVELDDWCRGILRKHWPDLPQWADVKTLDPAGDWPFGTVDVIGGGFPCQPFSVAGQQKGEADDRNLWPEVARLVRDLRPRGVFLENVAALLSSGYFSTIAGDLAACGYDAEWDCVPAAAVGAPHRRDRLWIVAYPASERWSGQGESRADVVGDRLQPSQLREEVADADGVDGERSRPVRRKQDVVGEPAGGTQPSGRRANVADPNRAGRGKQRRTEPARAQQLAAECSGAALADTDRARREHSGEGDARGERLVRWDPATRSGWWDVEPDVGRVANGVPQRVDRLRGLGNALVPQVAEPILRALRERLDDGVR